MRLTVPRISGAILALILSLTPTRVRADVDSDGDGLLNGVEVAVGTDPLDADSDDDGVVDGSEPSYNLDSDYDGLINALDPDSDNDGLYDGTEIGLSCSGPGTDTSNHHCTADADGGANTTNATVADTDGGGLRDGVEDANRNGQVDPGESDPSPGLGADDFFAPDTDGDGLSDAAEAGLGSDPNDSDSDDDGLSDGNEPNFADNTDGDCVINVLDPDSDNDGLADGLEAGQSCSSPAIDLTKNQCVADADAGATTTSVVAADTDGGGDIDGSEDLNRNGQIDAGETDPTAGYPFDDQINYAFSGCPASPAPGCRSAGKNSISLKRNASDNTKNSFSWAWGKGVDASTQADFGDPVGSSPTYRVCVYDQIGGVSSLKMTLVLSGGDICGAEPPWKGVSGKGWVYKAKAGNSVGVTSVKFKGGDARKPSLQLKAKGAAVPVPAPLSGTEYFDQDTSVVVQFFGSSPNRCWSSSFGTSNTKKNDGSQFKAAVKLP